jgi:hypothetical protein
MNNEPVAWAMFKDNTFMDAIHPDEHTRFEGGYTIPLYTHPAKTLTDEEILTAIKSIADDVGSYKEYENTYEDGWLDACNTVYDEVFAILRKAQEK